MTIINTLNNLAILSAGRHPDWTAQSTVDTPTGPPTLPTDGVDLRGAIVALLAVELDAATSVDFRLWLLADGTWYAANNGVREGVETSWIERAEVAGCTRAYIEIIACDDDVTPRIGPCVEEV